MVRTEPQEVLCKEVVLCKFHKETPVLEFPFNKVAGLKANDCIKKKIQHRCFPAKFAKFLRASILKNICEILLLIVTTITLRVTKI